MRKFKSVKQDQLFVNINAAACTLFNPSPYLVSAETCTFLDCVFLRLGKMKR